MPMCLDVSWHGNVIPSAGRLPHPITRLHDRFPPLFLGRGPCTQEAKVRRNRIQLELRKWRRDQQRRAETVICDGNQKMPKGILDKVTLEWMCMGLSWVWMQLEALSWSHCFFPQVKSHHLPVGPTVLQEPLVASLLLVAMPFAPTSVLAPSSKARSP